MANGPFILLQSVRYRWTRTPPYNSTLFMQQVAGKPFISCRECLYRAVEHRGDLCATCTEIMWNRSRMDAASEAFIFWGLWTVMAIILVAAITILAFWK